MIVANQGGAVSLAHSGSTKIATASTGVSITGGFTATDACTITTADNNAQLILVSTDNDATSGPEMQLYRNSASPADNDGVGQIQFRGNNDAAQEISYAEIDVLMRDVSDGTENGEIRLLVTRNGTSREAISLSGTDVVFNEGSEDIDFRVESNGNANMLFVDGGNDRVGIGTNSPAVELDIAGSGEMLHLSSTDTNKASIVGKGSSADRWKLGTLDSNDSVTLQASNSTGELIFETGGATERARISSGGRMSIGTTSTSFRFNVVSDQSDYVAQFDRNVDIDGNFRNHIKFSRGGTAVGEILTSQSATQYGTSSDHRLKENVEGMTGAIARVKQLSPKRFSWIVDDLDAPNFDGFLAHEAQAIVPQAVSGTHDNVDEDGNPVMQGIDHSMMVPLLTGALQEAIAEIETLKTKVAALEGE
jgi:prepilin-type processing-associated H-X9-DG protein